MTSVVTATFNPPATVVVETVQQNVLVDNQSIAVQPTTTLVVVITATAEGPAGKPGWSPRLRLVAVAGGFVQEVYAWADGEGTPPATGYLNASGAIVPNIADAQVMSFSAAMVSYDDSATNLGVTNMKDAIDALFFMTGIPVEPSFNFNKPGNYAFGLFTGAL